MGPSLYNNSSASGIVHLEPWNAVNIPNESLLKTYDWLPKGFGLCEAPGELKKDANGVVEDTCDTMTCAGASGELSREDVVIVVECQDHLRHTSTGVREGRVKISMLAGAWCQWC